MRQFGIVATSLLLIVCAGWGLSRAGGLDRQVLTEAPKSLQYRLQYWSATLQMIRDHFILGVGPGQFRWQYLFYKLPEASEEISDPHNLFLDAAANGGATAFTGLILICLLVTLTRRKSTNSRLSTHQVTHPNYSLNLVFGASAVGWLILLFTGADDRLLVVLPIASVLFWGLLIATDSFGDESIMMSIGSAAAATGLIAHLCGAGGIAMPAFNLLLLALVAVAAPVSRFVDRVPTLISGMTLGFATATIVGSIFLLWTTGIQPVALVQSRLFAGDRLVEKGLFEAADGEYASAARADIWASEPWRRRAELQYRRADAEQYRSNDTFQNAVSLLNEAKARDPAGFRDRVRLGKWWFAKWLVTRHDNDIRNAVTAFEEASARYPTNAELMAELALSLVAMKSDARAIIVAQQALRQDAINHERGHVDRFLGQPTRQKLQQLLAEKAD